MTNCRMTNCRNLGEPTHDTFVWAGPCDVSPLGPISVVVGGTDQCTDLRSSLWYGRSVDVCERKLKLEMILFLFLEILWQSL
jgi:hypothetical protein